MAGERAMTPTWAQKGLPSGVELVQIKGRWWLLTWTEEHVVATPDPERWAWTRGELGASAELELWIPPARHVADIAADLGKEETGAIAESA